jgi:hypothetical protein
MKKEQTSIIAIMLIYFRRGYWMDVLTIEIMTAGRQIALVQRCALSGKDFVKHEFSIRAIRTFTLMPSHGSERGRTPRTTLSFIMF